MSSLDKLYREAVANKRRVASDDPFRDDRYDPRLVNDFHKHMEGGNPGDDYPVEAPETDPYTQSFFHSRGITNPEDIKDFLTWDAVRENGGPGEESWEDWRNL